MFVGPQYVPVEYAKMRYSSGDVLCDFMTIYADKSPYQAKTGFAKATKGRRREVSRGRKEGKKRWKEKLEQGI
jgi:hypothetical protein